jgi:hypothetical protein
LGSSFLSSFPPAGLMMMMMMTIMMMMRMLSLPPVFTRPARENEMICKGAEPRAAEGASVFFERERTAAARKKKKE